MQINPLSLSLLIPTIILLVLAFMAWHRAGRSGAVICGIFMIACAVYSFGYAVQLSAASLEAQMDAIRLQYVGIAFIPPLLTLFILRLLAFDEWMNRFLRGFLLLLGAVTLGLALTNDRHHLLYLEIWLEPLGDFQTLHFKPGLWYWVSTAYIDLSVVFCIVLLLRRRMRAAPTYRGQLNLMIVCCLFPWLGHVVYLLGFSPHDMDLTPFALTVTGAGMVVGLRRYGLLDLVPIARGIVFDGMIEGVLVLDLRNRLVDTNPAAMRFVGVTREMIGQPIEGVFQSDEALARRFCACEEGSFEVVGDATDGDTPFCFEANLAPLLDRRRRPVGRLIVMRDISERKAAESERLEMERRLLHAQRLESLGILAGGIAHDFNNLLMVVDGNIEMARLLTGADDPVRTNLDNAMRGARRAADLTRQMLAYAGKGEFRRERLRLNRLVLDLVDFLEMSIPKHVDLSPPEPRNLPFVFADRGQVEQVVMNLVLNAAEAIGEGGGKVVIRTQVVECSEEILAMSRVSEKPAPGRFICLEVSDTGCGMDEKTLECLFDPFFTTKFVGRGLGMSAVLGIVRRHGGAILVDSERGLGTSVRVLFPIPVSDCADGESDPADSPPGETHPALTLENMAPLRGTVLAVDDEEAVLNLCKSMLARFGLTVLAVSRGAEAIRILEESGEVVDCVVLDLTMPEMDGVAVFEKIAEIRPGLKVLLASGYSAVEHARRFGDLGFAGFLQKPYRLDQLYGELRRVLGQ